MRYNYAKGILETWISHFLFWVWSPNFSDREKGEGNCDPPLPPPPNLSSLSPSLSSLSPILSPPITRHESSNTNRGAKGFRRRICCEKICHQKWCKMVYHQKYVGGGCTWSSKVTLSIKSFTLSCSTTYTKPWENKEISVYIHCYNEKYLRFPEKWHKIRKFVNSEGKIRKKTKWNEVINGGVYRGIIIESWWKEQKHISFFLIRKPIPLSRGMRIEWEVRISSALRLLTCQFLSLHSMSAIS